MIDPTILRRDALAGLDVGLSASDSADLARLGLDGRHVELAIGEIARAVLVAGGKLTYGGRLRPTGYTQLLMNEVERFGASRPSLRLCLAAPEFNAMRPAEVHAVDRSLGVWGRLILIGIDGTPIAPVDYQADTNDVEDVASAYSALRRYLIQVTHARVLVGGQLTNYRGAMPGLVEEAILCLKRGQPIFLAAGFGGAAAAVARALEVAPLDWLPEALPDGYTDGGVVEALAELRDVASSVGWDARSDGLTDDERALLVASHRPGEIASLVVLGIARALGNSSPSDEQ